MKPQDSLGRAAPRVRPTFAAALLTACLLSVPFALATLAEALLR